MNDIDWQLIEVFLRVAQQGSFTRAAELLGTSQPTVSRQIHALEESLGVALFARHARGFELTDRGEALLESARQVEDGVQTFFRRATGLTSEINGTVRLSASEPVAVYHLTEFLAGFLPEHPTINVEIVADNRPSDLLRREADIAVRMFQPTQLDLVVRRVGDIELGFFAHEDYLARRGTPVRLEELVDHTLIGYDADSTGFEFLDEYGIGREHFALRSDSLLTQFEAIIAGVGIGGAQVPVIRRFPRMRRLFEDIDVPAARVWLAVHRDLRHSPTIRAVFDALADFFAGR